MSKKQKITPKHTKNEINLHQFMLKFTERSEEFRLRLRQERLDHGQSVHELIEHGLQMANESLEYLQNNVTVFNALLTAILKRNRSYIYNSTMPVLEHKKCQYMYMYQLGGVDSYVSIGILFTGTHRQIIITRLVTLQETGKTYRCLVDPDHYRYLNCQQIMMELSKYRTPIRLLEMILLKVNPYDHKNLIGHIKQLDSIFCNNH